MDQTKRIVIGIPTFRRPQGLARLLASIATQHVQFTPHVLVADNDKNDRQGLDVVELTKTNGYPFPLTGIVVQERGISQVRNALMRVAFEDLAADGLAMVDDDERVEPNWLVALAAMQEQGGFDVVGGQVLPDFEHPPPRWTFGLSIYWRKVHKPGVISMVHGTGNIFLSRSLHESFRGCVFDPHFGLTGGEDKEFFTRLKRQGASFGFAPEAISYEHISSSRMTRRWALQRAYRIGCGDARIFRLHVKSARYWACELVKLAAALTVSPLWIVVTAWSPARQMRGCMLLARQLGKLKDLLGSPPQVYKVIHGK
jgi:glycosyltransferase involved in cell wall biosynthesis